MHASRDPNLRRLKQSFSGLKRDAPHYRAHVQSLYRSDWFQKAQDAWQATADAAKQKAQDAWQATADAAKQTINNFKKDEDGAPQVTNDSAETGWFDSYKNKIGFEPFGSKHATSIQEIERNVKSLIESGLLKPEQVKKLKEELVEAINNSGLLKPEQVEGLKRELVNAIKDSLDTLTTSITSTSESTDSGAVLSKVEEVKGLLETKQSTELSQITTILQDFNSLVSKLESLDIAEIKQLLENISTQLDSQTLVNTLATKLNEMMQAERNGNLEEVRNSIEYLKTDFKAFVESFEASRNAQKSVEESAASAMQSLPPDLLTDLQGLFKEEVNRIMTGLKTELPTIVSQDNLPEDLKQKLSELPSKFDLLTNITQIPALSSKVDIANDNCVLASQKSHDALEAVNRIETRLDAAVEARKATQHACSQASEVATDAIEQLQKEGAVQIE